MNTKTIKEVLSQQNKLQTFMYGNCDARLSLLSSFLPPDNPTPPGACLSISFIEDLLNFDLYKGLIRHSVSQNTMRTYAVWDTLGLGAGGGLGGGGLGEEDLTRRRT